MTDSARYFAGLAAALHAAGIAWPVIVIDKARLDANIDRLAADLAPGMALRVVAKSLPSPGLLRHVLTRTGTDRLMTFSTAMLGQLVQAVPGAGHLLGKPVPVAAARAVLNSAGAEALAGVQWLVDTPERIRQYADLAENTGTRLSVSLELDLGLHRGGMRPGPDLQAAIDCLRAAPQLRLSGVMGYEPHIPSLPGDWGERAREGAWNNYRAACAQIAEAFGAASVQDMVRNAGGSPTFRLYSDTSIANEMAAGSVLVKPSTFDQPLLAAYQPAAFIATPALKVQPTRYPAAEHSGRPLAAMPDERATTVFIHGGRWMADVVHPPGLTAEGSPVHSSNQDWLLGPGGLAIGPDDFVFLRPRQSEAVLLQFGDLILYEDGKITGAWPVLPASA